MRKEQKRNVFIKYLAIDDSLKNDIIFLPINAKSSHWGLFVLYRKEEKDVHFESLLSFTNIHETLKPVFQYLNAYGQIYVLKKLENIKSFIGTTARQ